MLTDLSIRDVVLIEALDLGFGEGLGVLTGETGAGKSILLDALGLALGGRGDSGLVRHGAAQAVVTATFDAPAPRIAARDVVRRERAGDRARRAVDREADRQGGRRQSRVRQRPAGVGGAAARDGAAPGRDPRAA
ncbi:AAA family ATPase [Sphingomonas sp. H160509]|nr:AAA family ATPase [Sphingomonas sp. H160509]MDD1451605.1 AAA family ATPase [Sphingomonas sp. H160509]